MSKYIKGHSIIEGGGEKKCKWQFLLGSTSFLVTTLFSHTMYLTSFCDKSGFFFKFKNPQVQRNSYFFAPTFAKIKAAETLATQATLK